MFNWILSLLFFLSFNWAYAQCPSADFNIPAQVCINEAVNIQFTSSAGLTYEWDFCSSDLGNNLSQVQDITAPVLKSPFHLELVKDNGIYRGFIANSASKNLLRLDYIHGLENEPTLNEVNIGNFFQDARCIRLIQDGDTWYGLVTDLAASKVFRLKFTGGLTSTPQIQELPSLGVSLPLDIALEKEGNDFVAIIINFAFADASITRLKFTNTMAATPQVRNDNILGVSATSISLQKTCASWLGFVALSASGNNIGRIDFGNSLFNASISSSLVNLPHPGIVNPIRGISIAEEGINFFGFINTSDGKLFRLDFGNNILNSSPFISDLNFMFSGPTTTAWDNEIYKDGSKWYLFIADYINNNARQKTFLSDCAANTDNLVTSIAPRIFFTEQGTQNLELRATDSNGNYKIVSKTLTVLPAVSPPLNFSKSNVICTNTAVEFNITSDLSTVTGVTWDMGDGSIFTSNPITYSFGTAGTYNTTLTATFSNGCKNFVDGSTQIYDPPDATFIIPPGLMCTNNEFTFTNNTPDAFNGNLSYQWYVDNQPESTARDLKYTFSTTGVKAIKLVTSIPGCSDELIQMTSSVASGPVVDFSYTGVCEGAATQFTNLISETVTGRNWSFGDGNSSIDPNPSNIFATSGQFTVSLTAASPNGCNNTKAKTVTINQKPQPDFTVDAPPQSCSGTITNFINLTPPLSDNSSIAEWLWDFNDPGGQSTSNQEKPGHPFVNAGIFNVSLKVTTSAGCSNITQKPITISESPSTAIVNSTACKNLPVNFVATGSNIKNYYWEMGTSYYLGEKATHIFNTTGSHLIKLTITGNNNCIRVYNRTVIVPVPLTPDFSWTKNCIGYNAVFTDLTSGADPVVLRQWSFPGTDIETASPTTEFGFNSTGTKEVKLKVTAQSGCSYTTPFKTVNVVPAPKASFTPTPDHGATPLKVQFNNTSSNATLFRWSFPDGTVSVSTQPSPSFTFKELGNHQVDLVASNIEGCEDGTSKSISVETPVPDVELKIITVSENEDGSLKVIITVHNKGNTVLNNLPVQIDISGNVLLKETIKEQITPSAMYNLVLSYGLTKTDNLKFLCAQADLQDDIAPESNRICTELQDKTFIFSSYPNPVYTELVIEWIARKDQIVHVFLYDAFGRKILHNEVQSSEGLNKNIFDVRELQSGIYFLIINDGFVQKTQRIFISPKN